MGRNEKWSSNDRNQLLVENFRKFMEEGDFSPDEEVVDEGIFDKVKGTLTGQNARREKIAAQIFSKFARALKDSNGDLEKTYSILTTKLKPVLKELGLKSAKDLFDYAPKGWVKKAVASQQARALGHNPAADAYDAKKSAQKSAQAEKEKAAKSSRMSDKDFEREMAFQKAQRADKTYMGR